MKRVLVRYTVKAGHVEENERYITSVFEQLDREKTPGLRYASFKLDDGVSFAHIASNETADDSNPLAELPAFKVFVAGIKDRCEQPPVVAELSEIGSYRFFGQ